MDVLHEEHAKTDLLLRLPFCETMQAFPRIEDIPLVTSPGNSRRNVIARLTRCDPGKKWVLLSFTTLDWTEEALQKSSGSGIMNSLRSGLWNGIEEISTLCIAGQIIFSDIWLRWMR